MAIRYQKNHAMRALNRHMTTYSENEARYVIDVTAFATDRAKWFIRQAMIQADIEADRVVIAYEGGNCVPVGPAHALARYDIQEMDKVYCCQYRRRRGGHCPHQSGGDGHVESMSAPIGGLWGAENAVTCFRSFISLLFGSSVVEAYASNHLARWLSFLHKAIKDIENMEAGYVSRIFSLPQEVVDLTCKSKGISGSELENLISSPNFGGHFELHGNNLKVKVSAIVRMFQFTVTNVKNAVETLLTNLAAIDHVIVVGGLSKCQILREQLQDQLGKVKVSFPADGDVFTVQGAVLSGHDLSLVSSRYVAVTYGLHNTVPYGTLRRTLNRFTKMTRRCLQTTKTGSQNCPLWIGSQSTHSSDSLFC